jgi:hypothetical protein
VLWEKLVLKRTIWNLRVLFCTTRLRLLVPIFENGQCIRQLLESATGSVLNTGDPTVFENCVPLMSPKTDLSKTVRDRMLSVVRVATIFLPQVEITWRDPSAAITGNTASEQEDREEDNARSERLCGYDPDRDVRIVSVCVCARACAFTRARARTRMSVLSSSSSQCLTHPCSLTLIHSIYIYICI